MRILKPRLDQVLLSDPSEFRPELFDIKNIDSANKPLKEFRNYEESARNECVRKTYRDMHINQTVQFVKEKQEKWLKFNHAEMTIMEAVIMLDNLVDESDPDIELPNSIHAFQTAERIREEYPNEDWFHLAGLLHDLGKVMALWGEPQWCVVGDTFPVGCKFQETCVYHEFFQENQDYFNSKYSTMNGIYEKHCGLDDVMMSWGHDEYMYQMLKANSTSLPDEALYMIRYHSFYPFHTAGGYRHLANEKDLKMLPWIKAFNSFDLYTKSDEIPDVEAVKPYYQSLIDKYIPGGLKW